MDTLPSPKTVLHAPTGHTVRTDEVETGQWRARHVVDLVGDTTRSYFVVRRELDHGTFTQNYCRGGDEAVKFDHLNPAVSLAKNLNAMHEMHAA